MGPEATGPTPTRIFLTGGTGLVGSHSAASLVDGGHLVTALCRRGGDPTYLRALGCTIVEGDIRDGPETLAASMEGCSHVVHAAALVYAGGDLDQVRSVNARGTRNVLRGAALGGVQRAVHVSSVSVYGGAEPPVDEHSPTDGALAPGNHYARSKREAELEAREAEAATDLPVTILRPAAVYGERDRLLSRRVAALVRRRVTFLLGSGRNTIPAVYAGNVAEAVLLTVRAGLGEATFDVGMDHPLTQRQLMEGIAGGMGIAPRFIPLPAALVEGGASLLGTLGVSAPGASGLPLSRVARLALNDNPYQSLRLRTMLGWDPPHRHENALRRTGQWLQGAHR